jgi:hypothetical protein
MGRVLKYLMIIFMVSYLVSCSPTREASSRDRAGIMLLKPEEYTRNKPYKPSNLKHQIHKKAKKSLLKDSYKIK